MGGKEDSLQDPLLGIQATGFRGGGWERVLRQGLCYVALVVLELPMIV